MSVIEPAHEMRIDAHLHFWRPACDFDNRPVADHAAYRRDFMPGDVAAELDACGIDGVILVQTCPQTEETDWLLDLAASEPRVIGVTAWVNLDRPRCDFSALLARSKVVGIRAQLRRVADDAFVTRRDRRDESRRRARERPQRDHPRRRRVITRTSRPCSSGCPTARSR